MARSAYSRSSECGKGIAMRTGMRLAHPLDGGQSLSLAMVTNFHNDRQDKNDGAGHQGHRQGKLAIGKGHIGMQAVYSRQNDGADNSYQHTHPNTEHHTANTYDHNPHP